MPLKGIMNPKIATPSSNQGKNNEKHKFNMPNVWTMLNLLTNHPTKSFALLWVAFAYLGSRIPQIDQKAPNAYEKLQMPLKGIVKPQIATPSSNQGTNDEKHKFNMPKCKDNAKLTNESSYQEFCFALGGFCRSCFPDSPNGPRMNQMLVKRF